MAVIRRYGPLNHVRSEATAFLAVYRGGRLRKSGRGAAAWFGAAGATSLVEIPAADREHIVQVSATTRDFQVVSVQGAATWRAAAPLTLAERIDFSIDRRSGAHRGEPVAQIEALIDALIRGAVERHVATRTVAGLLDEGVAPLLGAVEAAVAAPPRLTAIGVEVAGVQLAALSPSPELVRALRLPTVERLQQAADEATFARRAAAVEKETAIAENETKAKIGLEEERARLIARERENELARAHIARETAEVAAEGAAQTRTLASQAEAAAIVRLDEARLQGERERAAIARSMPPVVVLAEAMKQGLGASKIGTLNLGPDVVSLVGAALAKAAG